MNSGEVSKRIHSLRIESGLKAFEIADDAGISAAYFSQIESGKRKPSEVVVCRIARALRVSGQWLLTGEGIKRPALTQSEFYRRFPRQKKVDDLILGKPDAQADRIAEQERENYGEDIMTELHRQHLAFLQLHYKIDFMLLSELAETELYAELEKSVRGISTANTRDLFEHLRTAELLLRVIESRELKKLSSNASAKRGKSNRKK